MEQTAGIEETIRKFKIKSCLAYLNRIGNLVLEVLVRWFIGYPVRFVAWIILKFSIIIAKRRALKARIDPEKTKCPACGAIGIGVIKLIPTMGVEKVALEYHCLVCSANSYHATLRPAEKWYSKPAEAPQKGR
jgi:hypothetical protein